MAIQIDGTTVIDDSRNITNVVSANVTSLSVGGTAVTASVAELNYLVGIDTSTTIQQQIDSTGLTANTLVQTFSSGQSANLVVADITTYASPISVLKDVSGTLTSAIPGVDYTSIYVSNTMIQFTALTAGDYTIRTIGSKEYEPIGFVGYAIAETTTAVSNLQVDLSGIDIQAGDVGIFVAGFRSGTTQTPSNWTGDFTGTRIETAHITFSGGETSTTINGSSMDDGFASVFVYRGYSSPVYTGFSTQSSGMPDTSVSGLNSGDKVFMIGILEDDIITMTAPEGYLLLVSDNVGVSENGLSYAMAEKNISISGIDNPGPFGGDGLDVAYTTAFRLTPL